MKGKRLKLSVLIAISLLLLAGCNLFPDPASLIQAPKQVTASNQPVDMISIAKRNLPKGTELSVPNGPVGVDSVISVDLDGDDKVEALVLYQSTISQKQVGAFVLKEGKKGWGKIFAKKGTGFEISWASATDVTGDGNKEILLGWQSGESAGNILEIYHWNENKITKLKELNYHEMEAITFESDQITRLALWKRDMADAYKIELLGWDGKSFVPDRDHYPSYFQKVIDFYKQRIAEVPDAAYYWYYLADAALKANHPEFALEAVETGMKLKSVVPTKDNFQQLKVQIEMKLKEVMNTDVTFEVSDPDLTFRVPRSLAPYVSIKAKQGQDNAYILSVEISSDQSKKEPLFLIEVYPRDMMEPKIDPKIIKIGEDKVNDYFIRNSEIPTNSINEIIKKSIAGKDQIISSIQLGPSNPNYSSLEDEYVIHKVKEAAGQYWYVMSGGKFPEKIETVTINDSEYRYLGSDLDTNTKMLNYLSRSFTASAIESFLKRANIFEYFERLIQPNADGGSLLNYDLAEVVQKKDKGDEKEFDIKVPVGNSFSYEFVHISFQKTENGWRIFSEPGTF